MVSWKAGFGSAAALSLLLGTSVQGAVLLNETWAAESVGDTSDFLVGSGINQPALDEQLENWVKRGTTAVSTIIDLGGGDMVLNLASGDVRTLRTRYDYDLTGYTQITISAVVTDTGTETDTDYFYLGYHDGTNEVRFQWNNNDTMALRRGANNLKSQTNAPNFSGTHDYTFDVGFEEGQSIYTVYIDGVQQLSTHIDTDTSRAIASSAGYFFLGHYSGTAASYNVDSVVITAVPEPTSLSVLALAGSLLAARRRRVA